MICTVAQLLLSGKNLLHEWLTTRTSPESACGLPASNYDMACTGRGRVVQGFSVLDHALAKIAMETFSAELDTGRSG